MDKTDLINKKYYVLDDNIGYVKLLDIMPHPSTTENADLEIVKAARISFEGTLKGDEKDRKLIDYLIKNNHTSPLEMIEYKFEIYCPLPIAVQWMRHRTGSYNQTSRRYTDENIEFYDMKMLRVQDKKNHQASIYKDDLDYEYFSYRIEKIQNDCYDLYNDLIEKGVSREQARMVLPQSLYTRFIFKMDLHNLLKFLSLRVSKHAQWEMQMYAACILENFIKVNNEWVYESYNKYNPFEKIIHNNYILRNIEINKLDFKLEVNGKQYLSHNNSQELIQQIEKDYIIVYWKDGDEVDYYKKLSV